MDNYYVRIEGITQVRVTDALIFWCNGVASDCRARFLARDFAIGMRIKIVMAVKAAIASSRATLPSDDSANG